MIKKHFTFLVIFISATLFIQCNYPKISDSLDSNLTQKKKSSDSIKIQRLNSDCSWERPPKFPGGEKGLTNFFSKNLVYPYSSKKEGIEGKVYVYFIIDTLGKITNSKIKKGLSSEINKEVLRVLTIMPDWIPGTCSDKKKIRLGLTLPIEFKIK